MLLRVLVGFHGPALGYSFSTFLLARYHLGASMVGSRANTARERGERPRGGGWKCCRCRCASLDATVCLRYLVVVSIATVPYEYTVD